MNIEDLLTKLQAERKTWQDRANEQLTKAEQGTLVKAVQSHLAQAQYDQGVAWGLYLSSTLILQEQLETESNLPEIKSLRGIFKHGESDTGQHQNAQQSSGKALASDSEAQELPQQR